MACAVGLIQFHCAGGLQVRLDLLKQNFILSILGAATGVCFPIGLSYLLLYLGYGYGKYPRSTLDAVTLTLHRRCRNIHHRSSTVRNIPGHHILRHLLSSQRDRFFPDKGRFSPRQRRSHRRCRRSRASQVYTLSIHHSISKHALTQKKASSKTWANPPAPTTAPASAG